MNNSIKKLLYLGLASLLFLFGNMTFVNASDCTSVSSTDASGKTTTNSYCCEDMDEYDLYKPSNYHLEATANKSSNSSSVTITTAGRTSSQNRILSRENFRYRCNDGRSGSVSYGQPVTISDVCTFTMSTSWDLEDSTGATIYVDSEGKRVSSASEGHTISCSASVEFNSSLESFNPGGSSSCESPSCKFDPRLYELDKAMKRKIDCDHPKNDFQASICKAKTEAEAAGLDNTYFPDKFGEKDIYYNNGSFYSSSTFSGTGGSSFLEVHRNLKFMDVANANDPKATQDGHSITENKTALLKCNPSKVDKKNENMVDLIAPGAEGDDYYRNVAYMYGSGVSTLHVGKYEYHYNGPEAPYTEEVSCKVKCEEAVTVKFGPPVSSKAGACFEYKVKVISRVNCSLEKPPVPPKYAITDNITVTYPDSDPDTDLDTIPEPITDLPNPDPICYCNPSAYCVHSDGTVYRQGGPNEDFDSCIQSCDGGKYSSKCNHKCYQEVYGNAILGMTNSSKKITDVQKLANVCIAPYPTDSEFCGYYTRSPHPTWISTSSRCTDVRDVNPSARWFQEQSWYGFNHPYYPGDDGIPRSNGCTDVCWWDFSSCGTPRVNPSGSTPGTITSSRSSGIITYTYTPPRNDHGPGNLYLNPKWPTYDYSHNINIYNIAVDQCTAAATCTTSTSEYTISSDVEDYKGDRKTINFPYTTLSGREHDYLSSGDGSGDTRSARNTTLIDKVSKGYGCYDGDAARNWYRSEWTFPGSYINNKTMEVSYLNHEGNPSWQKKKGFCLPLTAKNVNRDWWLWYNYKKIVKKGGTSASNLSTSICGSWTVTTGVNGSNPNTDDKYGGPVEDWNINAYADKFGYYEWNVHVQCFYALNTMMPQPTCSGDSCKPDCCLDENCTDTSLPQGPYRIRPVDLKQLFPATGGGSGERQNIGFNWTQYAKHQVKGSNYSSDPAKYKEEIQSLGSSVYSDNYLDYYFELSIETLRGLKGKKSNYADYQGDIRKRDNGITSYYSSDIRPYAKKAPDKGPATTCNNLNAPGGKSGHRGYSCHTS